MVIAVSLDVKNAFNSLPWLRIREVLRRKGFPSYIRKVLDDYLSNRSIEYTNCRGEREVAKATAGVPQGSVLGPVLWDIAYDRVLREGTEEGCRVLCFADDTLVMAGAEDVTVVVGRANIQTSLVISRIKRLGLEVAPHKTEVVCFSDRTRIERPLEIEVDGVKVDVKKSMRYLGVILDNKLSFGMHLDYVEKKVASISRALCRITLNLRGPRESRKKLYGGVILSVILYAAVPRFGAKKLADQGGIESV